MNKEKQYEIVSSFKVRLFSGENEEGLFIQISYPKQQSEMF